MTLPVCGENSTCVNTVGSFKCVCKDGFIADGEICAGKFLIGICDV